LKIGLISCTKKKRSYACLASEMYSISTLFKKSYSYCNDHYCRVYILSAKYGLLRPNEVIQPYDQTLNAMNMQQKKEWSERVYQQFLMEMKNHSWNWSDIRLVAFHAGEAYRKFLIERLAEYVTVSVPMQGLGIGEQLSFYKKEGY
jgi:cytoplasmic iron level regulating protein YaaA (DUF328/UPF0246 family)